MKEASVCPQAIDASSESVGSNSSLGRRKRSSQCNPVEKTEGASGENTPTQNSDQTSNNNQDIISECVETNSMTVVDPDNPLELIFNPEKQGDRDVLINNAKKEYRDNYSGMDIKTSYNALFEILWYTQIPCFDVRKITSTEQHQHGMIKSCIWKGVRLPCSKLFTASPTDRGMCCTFNVQAAEKMFKSGDYQTMIKSMQKRDKSMAFDLQENWPKAKHEFDHFEPEAGVSKGLTLMLDSHSDLLSGSSISDDFQGFIAVVNDNKQFPITTQKSVLIRPGHYNLVSIQATKVSAKSDIRKYTPEKRSCYFHDESPLRFHNIYSQGNCKLECQVSSSIVNGAVLFPSTIKV